MTREANDPTRAGGPVPAAAAVLLSRNEVEALCTKAARGAGMGWGHADEAGGAVGWLQARGIDGAAALLAALDLATAGGQGHYTSVLTGGGEGFADDIRRRSTLAWQQLWNGNMPVITLTCLLAAAFAIRNREMFRPWAGPIWPAALVGGLAGGLIGSFTEDSGPLLIVVATITLTGVCAYLLGRPDDSRIASGESPQRQE